MHSPLVTVVIVTYESADIVGECLASIPLEVPVVVVDNASRDATVQRAGEVRPQATIIASPENLGFGRACNRGMATVTTPYALLLNPDCRLQPDTIAALLEAASRYPEAMIVAPSLWFADSSFQPSFRNHLFTSQGRGLKQQEPEGECCAEFISGAAMLLNRAHVTAIGGFDERIFLFYEDDDLCLRARQAGYELIVTPRAKVTHLRGGSSHASRVNSIKEQHMAWSRLYLEQKYRGVLSARRLCIAEMARSVAKMLGYTLGGNLRKAVKYRYRLQGQWRWMRWQAMGEGFVR